MSESNPTPAAEERDRAQAGLFTVQKQIEEVRLEQTQIELELRQRRLRELKASADAHRIYPFFGEVSSSSVSGAIETLSQWSREDPGCDIEIVLNSPGGEVIAGLALYDYIDELKDAGHKVTTKARGYAASMGGVLLQAGTERVIGKRAYLMIHEISGMSFGNVSEQEDALKFSKRLQDDLLEILAERSTLSKRQIANRWKRKDWWLDAEEAVKFGFADRIG